MVIERGVQRSRSIQGNLEVVISRTQWLIVCEKEGKREKSLVSGLDSKVGAIY